MGCICSKATATSDDEICGDKGSKKFSKRFFTSSKREEIVVETDSGGGADGQARLIPSPRENVASTPIYSDERENKVIKENKPVSISRVGPVVHEGSTKYSHQKRSIVDVTDHRQAKVGVAANGHDQSLRIFTVPNVVEAELVAAGWPSWLTSVSCEAIRGWVPRRADSFEKLDKIGQGTYSSVYRARDLETGKVVALKKVRFLNMDPESVRFMAREIQILRRLDHPNVIKLEGLVTSRMSCSMYLVFEYMEHDLAGLAATPGIKFTEPQVKCYMQQLLVGLEHCHDRGVLHRDIKGSNLLIDNSGNLRIGDFGLATYFHPGQKQPLTSRVVTLWYRPPELLLGATEYGVAVDMWSTGCILGELLAGKPVMPGRTEVEQLHKIFKLCGSPLEEYWRKSKLPHATIFKPQQPYRRCVAETFKEFPASALTLLDVLLAIEPDDRGTATSALKSEFFTTRPLPCEPSSLPKYPPSKEFDAKLREEEARKQRAAAMKGHGADSMLRGPIDSKVMPAADANAELRGSTQKRNGQSNPKSTSEKYNPEEEGGSGFPLNPPRGSSANGVSHSGPLYHPNAFGSSWNSTKKFKEDEIRPAFGSLGGPHGPELKTQRSCMPQVVTDVSNHSGFGSSRANAKSDNHRETNNSYWSEQRSIARYNPLDDTDPGKQEWTHHLLDAPTSSLKKTKKVADKDSTVGYTPKKSRIHYSGPLFPTGENIDEMLREHERQIQQAVRKARLDKVKTKKSFGEKTHSQSLLHTS
ncbi:probable serine/threonine-protein kinase At1g54610 isoform X2 [Aristolochia californica]|uniref:probable serine/threonine-protein kinase At1g54610 isoform X2 n=1 Tax=Aristolochia californica TaxID=171875 RepID=UPI0035E33018